MIVKTLSRKNGINQLLTYIFKERKMFGFEESRNVLPALEQRGYFPKWLELGKQDLKYLKAEKEDKKLWQEFKAKAPDGNIQQFVQNYLLPKQKDLAILHNLRSASIEGLTKEFKENESRRLTQRKDNTQVLHNIISFSKHDTPNINHYILQDIANKFIELRGTGSLYAGSIHQDKDHYHIHLAQSGVQLSGKSARISKQEFQELKIALQEYQKEKYPELSHSLPVHTRDYIEKGQKPNVKNERLVEKDSLLQSLDEVYAKSKSSKDFLEQLANLGHAAYYRNGRLQGVRYNGDRKFRLGRLGYDEKKLQALEERTIKEDKALTELRGIRASRHTERDREDEVRYIQEESEHYQEDEIEKDDTPDNKNDINETETDSTNTQYEK